MNDKIQCGTCMWWVNLLEHDDPNAVGECRRHAPQFRYDSDFFQGTWLETRRYEFCGDHQLKREEQR